MSDYAELRKWAESGDCDVPGWIGTETLNALDELAALRERVSRLEGELAQAGTMLTLHKEWLEQRNDWLERSSDILDVSTVPEVPLGVAKLKAAYAALRERVCVLEGAAVLARDYLTTSDAARAEGKGPCYDQAMRTLRAALAAAPAPEGGRDE